MAICKGPRSPRCSRRVSRGRGVGFLFNFDDADKLQRRANRPRPAWRAIKCCWRQGERSCCPVCSRICRFLTLFCTWRFRRFIALAWTHQPTPIATHHRQPQHVADRGNGTCVVPGYDSVAVLILAARTPQHSLAAVAPNGRSRLASKNRARRSAFAPAIPPSGHSKG